MSQSDYAEAASLDFWYNATGTPPPIIYIALFNVAPTDAGGGTEVSGTGYLRAAVTAGFTVATGPGTATNNVDIVFPLVGAGAWGTINAFASFDSQTPGGNMIDYGNVTTPRTPIAGEVVQFGIGDLVFERT